MTVFLIDPAWISHLSLVAQIQQGQGPEAAGIRGVDGTGIWDEVTQGLHLHGLDSRENEKSLPSRSTSHI